MTEILEKSGNFMRGKKWEPCMCDLCYMCVRFTNYLKGKEGNFTNLGFELILHMF